MNLWPRFDWHLGRNPDFLTRGFLNREVMDAGCTVLDIGCGDGLFDYLFYSAVAARVDALDIEEEAITMARRQHAAPNIRYYLANCVTQGFPEDRYDVVVWDGAIAHFAPNDVARVMTKIHRVLDGRGLLVGSEDLQPLVAKNWDHNFVFPEPQDLKRFLLEYFPQVVVKEIPPLLGRYREGYFRCGYSRVSLRVDSWN